MLYSYFVAIIKIHRADKEISCGGGGGFDWNYFNKTFENLPKVGRFSSF